MHRLSTLSILLLSSAYPALAQDPILLDEIVVIGGLLPTEPDRTGATVEVVEGEETAAAGPSASQLLATLPGLSVAANGGLGSSTTLRLRGLGNSYIGVTLDGIEITDPATTQTALNFGTLMTGGIDKITVLKGTQSAVYGSEAIAGIIAAESWRPADLGFSGRLSTEVGSYETSAGSASVGYLDDRAELALTLSRVTTEGFSAQDFNTEDDGYEQTALNVFAAYRVSDTLRLGVSGLWSDGTSEFDRSSFTLDSTGEIDETRRGLRAFAEVTGGAVTHEFAASVFQTDRFDAGGFTRSFEGERVKLEYLGTAEVSATTTLAFGVDWTEETATLDGASNDINTGAVFGEVQYGVSDTFDVALSLRYDEHSEFGGEGSGRVALAWRPGEETIVRAAMGAGHRAPSLFELFAVPFGNPDLQPETSRSADLGIERRIGERGFARATLFYTEIDDLIDYDFATNAYVQVAGTTVSKGIELAAEYNVTDRLALGGSYTYTDAQTGDDRLIRAPRHDLVLSLDAALTDRLSAGLTVQHVADTLDGFGSPTPLEDYTVANATLTYALSDDAEAYLRIENLTDEQYQTVRGYNTSDRAVYVGLRTSF